MERPGLRPRQLALLNNLHSLCEFFIPVVHHTLFVMTLQPPFLHVFTTANPELKTQVDMKYLFKDVHVTTTGIFK